jgi:hypothetical protein
MVEKNLKVLKNVKEEGLLSASIFQRTKSTRTGDRNRYSVQKKD